MTQELCGNWHNVCPSRPQQLGSAHSIWGCPCNLVLPKQEGMCGLIIAPLLAHSVFQHFLLSYFSLDGMWCWEDKCSIVTTFSIKSYPYWISLDICRLLHICRHHICWHGEQRDRHSQVCIRLLLLLFCCALTDDKTTACGAAKCEGFECKSGEKRQTDHVVTIAIMHWVRTSFVRFERFVYFWLHIITLWDLCE